MIDGQAKGASKKVDFHEDVTFGCHWQQNFKQDEQDKVGTHTEEVVSEVPSYNRRFRDAHLNQGPDDLNPSEEKHEAAEFHSCCVPHNDIVEGCKTGNQGNQGILRPKMQMMK